MIQIFLASLKDFQSSELDASELEDIILEAVKKNNKFAQIKKINYNNKGVLVELNDGDLIEIIIDWNEIIIKE